MIRGRRIINVKPHLIGFKKGEILYISIKYNGTIKDKLLNIGFSKIEEGESILPIFKSKVSITNSDGLEIVRKDLPKIQYLHELPYLIKDYGGHIHEGVNYIPKLKYQRDLIDFMGVYLNIESKNGEFMIISDPIKNELENEFKIKNTINLFLEIFGEANITNDTFKIFTTPKIIRFNFEFLKKGEYPWEKTKDLVINSVGKKYGENITKYIKNRWNIIEDYKPDFIGYGIGGFRGYICFGFKEKNLYILESSFLNNATYIFNEKWEDISILTKASILKGNLFKYRIIHGINWQIEIDKILS